MKRTRSWSSSATAQRFPAQARREPAANNLRAMARLARSRGAQVVLIGVPKPACSLDAGLYADVAANSGFPRGERLAENPHRQRLEVDLVHPTLQAICASRVDRRPAEEGGRSETVQLAVETPEKRISLSGFTLTFPGAASLCSCISTGRLPCWIIGSPYLDRSRRYVAAALAAVAIALFLADTSARRCGPADERSPALAGVGRLCRAAISRREAETPGISFGLTQNIAPKRRLPAVTASSRPR